MEIGGYLEYEQYFGNEYHRDCLRINTARNCLKYLIDARHIRKIWLSRLNCSAVLDTCRNSGLEIGYFDLDEDLRPILPSEYNTDDYVYVVNYYGQLCDVHYKHMILDNVQAFFQRPLLGIDTIYSCRKFFGVSDGAYLYTNAVLDQELERDISCSRITYLAGRYEKSASEYYSDYQKNEERLDCLPLMKMSSFTENILKSIDYETVKKKREDNFLYLHEKLGCFNQLKIRIPIGPFAYPFLIEHGFEYRKLLQSENIYIAKLWPNVTDLKEGELSNNILPLPCDHRYGKDEMSFVANQILKYI